MNKLRTTTVKKHKRRKPVHFIPEAYTQVRRHKRTLGYRDQAEVNLLGTTHLADIHGVGGKSSEILSAHGFNTLEDAQRLAEDPVSQSAVMKSGVRPQTLKAIFDELGYEPKREMILEEPEPETFIETTKESKEVYQEARRIEEAAYDARHRGYMDQTMFEKEMSRAREMKEKARKLQETEIATQLKERSEIHELKREILRNMGSQTYRYNMDFKAENDPKFAQAVKELEEEEKIHKASKHGPYQLGKKFDYESSWDKIIAEQEAIKQKQKAGKAKTEKFLLSEAKQIENLAEDIYPVGSDLKPKERYYIIMERKNGQVEIPEWRVRPIWTKDQSKVEEMIQRAKAENHKPGTKYYVVPGRDKHHAEEKISDLSKIDVLITDTPYEDRKFWRYEKGLKAAFENRQFIGWRGKLRPEEIETLQQEKIATITKVDTVFTEALQADSTSQRLLKRAQKKLEQAARQEALGKKEIEESRELRSVIPMGQPILVGHHSEKKHRKLLERTRKKDEKGYHALKKAEKLRSQAQSLKIQATQKKGSREEARQQYRESTDEWLETGKRVFSVHYGEGIITKINKKTVQIKRTENAKPITVDKTFIYKSREHWLKRPVP